MRLNTLDMIIKREVVMLKSDIFISDIMAFDILQSIVKQCLMNEEHISCYLFGSYAKKTPTKSSDIDLLLIYDKNSRVYSSVLQISDEIKKVFAEHEKYCQPILGCTNNINDDNHILFRQYINYGILLHGRDIRCQMNDESKEELMALEYYKYWVPLYQKKIVLLEKVLIIDQRIFLDIYWQYLFLIVYWYAKAQLCLIYKHHSLNNYTLVYIYSSLMHTNLSIQEIETLTILQKYRDLFKSDEPLVYEKSSFVKHFNIVKKVIQCASKN